MTAIPISDKDLYSPLHHLRDSAWPTTFTTEHSFDRSPQTKKMTILKTMKSPTLLYSQPPLSSSQNYTHRSIHQSIHNYFQQPLENPPPNQTRPNAMPIPTFSCGHQLLPLPQHNPYPCPVTLPFPCRSCHMTAVQSSDDGIRARYDALITELERQLALARERQWIDPSEFLSKRIEEVEGQRKRLKETKDYELRQCWKEFDGRWGGPML